MYRQKFMLRGIALFVSLLAIGLLIPSVFAQQTPMHELHYWTLLEQTYAVLQNQPEQSTLLPGLSEEWSNVNRVQLSTGQMTSVDMRWLSEGLTQTGGESLESVEARVKALLDYRTEQLRLSGEGDPLGALDRVLQDGRFQYPAVTPTPLPPTEDDFQLPNLPLAGAGFSQLILIAAGIAVVVLVVAYFARGFQMQGRTVQDPLEPGDDPETSADARQLASESEGAKDYRSAVRYLYLSILLMLDERGLIHYDRAQTNREHLAQIVNQPQFLEILRSVVYTFDRVWYGFAPLDEADYQAFCQNIERLRELAR